MKLEKFTKNKKQKRIVIGSIVGILMLIGGISLYRSFALYKEEKTFDVLNGTVPDFAYKENILNGADPVLKEELIPININEENGEVTKADIKDEWYNYEDKKWANAVILVDNTKEYKNDEVIPEENIESYFVWIPKYKYKIFDMGKYTEAQLEQVQDIGSTTAVEIQFGLTDTIDDETKKECKTPNASGEDGTCDVNDWMTHPAFTAFENSKGFWVGKFETGYNQDTTNSNIINVNESWTKDGAHRDEQAPKKLIIKPNVYSWRAININNMYANSYNYQRKLESHMMKNTEWGAVAYLSQSIYGTCEVKDGNIVCSRIANNNNTNFITGYQSETSYFDKSVLASTTSNYSGIYDMSGGAWDAVMAYSKGTNFQNLEIDKQYRDLYDCDTNTSIQYNKRILGDATGELGPFFDNRNNYYESSFFNEYANFPGKNFPFIFRGGYYNGTRWYGIFAFYSFASGAAGEYVGYRIVLTPQ